VMTRTPEHFPSAGEMIEDVLAGRPLFRAPSLDELVGMLDFRSFAAQLSRTCDSFAQEVRSGRGFGNFSADRRV
jgi:hypothetical protein